MRIKEILAAPIRRPEAIFLNWTPNEPDHRRPGGGGPKDLWDWAHPMSRYPKVKSDRSLRRLSPDRNLGCIVTAEDGTWGFGSTSYNGPVVPIINEQFAPVLIGEECMATEKLWDMMYRMTSPYGPGLGNCAMSAVDIALWDLKGKLLGRPVYELLGGPARDKVTCYASGNNTEWHMKLGFKATKLFCPAGPADGLAGLDADEELVSRTRELVGTGVELMLDCWMALDVEFAVRLAERLRPYDLKWMEDCLMPEDIDGYVELRKRIPWQSLGTGEHWFSILPFFSATSRRIAEVLQPDVNWVGGITAVVKICHYAEAAGISVIPHCGGNVAEGQHLALAMPSMPWAEFGPGAPDVPLVESFRRIPGTVVPENGCLVPSNAPGLGLDISKGDLEMALT